MLFYGSHAWFSKEVASGGRKALSCSTWGGRPPVLAFPAGSGSIHTLCCPTLSAGNARTGATEEYSPSPVLPGDRR